MLCSPPCSFRSIQSEGETLPLTSGIIGHCRTQFSTVKAIVSRKLSSWEMLRDITNTAQDKCSDDFAITKSVVYSSWITGMAQRAMNELSPRENLFSNSLTYETMFLFLSPPPPPPPPLSFPDVGNERRSGLMHSGHSRPQSPPFLLVTWSAKRDVN